MKFILRHRVDRDFTVLANRILRDKRLSYCARGLLSHLLHYPPEWKLSLSFLARQGPNGRDATARYARELVDTGYLTIARERDQRGKFTRTIWTVTDTPDPQTAFPDVDSPEMAKPPAAIPHPEKLTLLSIKEQEELSNTTTTTCQARSLDVGVVDPLDIPPLLAGDRRNSVDRILSQCPQHQRQAVIYEVAGVASRGKLKNPLGLLRALTRSAKYGEFVPDAAIDYARKLKREEDDRRLADTVRAECDRNDPAAREAGRKALVALRATLPLRSAVRSG